MFWTTKVLQSLMCCYNTITTILILRLGLEDYNRKILRCCLSEWAKRPHGRSTTASRPPSATCRPSSTVAFPTTPRTSSCACWTSTPSKSCCIAGSDRTAGCPTKTSTQSAYGHRPIASEYRYTMAANWLMVVSAFQHPLLLPALWIEISKHIHIKIHA